MASGLARGQLNTLQRDHKQTSKVVIEVVILILWRRFKLATSKNPCCGTMSSGGHTVYPASGPPMMPGTGKGKLSGEGMGGRENM